MKHITCLLLAVGAVSAASVILEPYAQCGGLSYRGAWECPTGYACLGTQSDAAFPNYMCVLPGATSGPAFPYAQCGGQGFTGPTRCAAGWYCLKANDFFSQCAQLPGVTTPATPTPELADPGNFCGISATERGYPTECVPGFTCSGPGVFGYWICLPKPSTSTTTATYTKTLVTTAKSTTTKSTTTAKTTTKTTTTQKKTTTTTTKKATSTYKA